MVGIRRKVKKIPSKTLLSAQIKIDEIMDMLKPYLIDLSQPERRALVKIEEGSLKFLELSQRLAVDYPELFSNFTQTALFREEFSAVHELSLFAKKIYVLRDKISDTEILAGNRTLAFALDYYNTIKIAARHDIPGTKIVYEELKRNFPAKKQNRRKRKPKEDARQLDLFES